VFSPDGARIATASADEATRIWDAETGDEITSLPGDPWLDQVAFSPDGTRLLTATDQYALIWDIEAGDLASSLDGAIERTAPMPFSPQGTRLVGALGGKASVWNAISGRKLMTLADVHLALFHPDGLRLLTVSDGGRARLLEAAPFNREMLPGDSSMTWEDRFQRYRQQQLAHERPFTPTGETPFELVVAPRDEVRTRLRQLLRAYGPGFGGEEAPQESEDWERGFLVAQGLPAQILARLCLREGDRIVRVNGADISGQAACLAHFGAFLRASDRGTKRGLSLLIEREDRAREIRFLFRPATESYHEVAVPRVLLEPMLAAPFPVVLEEGPNPFEDYDLRQAKWHREPALDTAAAGFWLDSAYTPLVDGVLERVGLQPGDQIIAIDGTPVHSSQDLPAVAARVAGQLADGTATTWAIEVRRGLFQRLTIDVHVR